MERRLAKDLQILSGERVVCWKATLDCVSHLTSPDVINYAEACVINFTRYAYCLLITTKVFPPPAGIH